MVAAEAMRVADASNHPYSVCHGCLGLGGTRVRQGEFDAAIGVLARTLGAELVVVDVGLSGPPVEGVLHRRAGDGSADSPRSRRD